MAGRHRSECAVHVRMIRSVRAEITMGEVELGQRFTRPLAAIVDRLGVAMVLLRLAVVILGVLVVIVPVVVVPGLLVVIVPVVVVPGLLVVIVPMVVVLGLLIVVVPVIVVLGLLLVIIVL